MISHSADESAGKAVGIQDCKLDELRMITNWPEIAREGKKSEEQPVNSLMPSRWGGIVITTAPDHRKM